MPFPSMATPLEKPAGFTLHLHVPDVDAAFDKAVKVGGEVVLPSPGHVLGRLLRPVPRPVRRAVVDGRALKKG